MKEKEFKQLKVGDKVRIVKEKTGSAWNIDGKMDKWLGKVMTVRKVLSNVVCMKEDWGEHILGCGWVWTPEMIAEKVEEYPTIVEHLIKDRTTIVKLSNGKVGVAKCNPEDEFDFYEGLRLATARAYGKEPPYKKVEKVKEVKRKAKAGEWIKIVSPGTAYECYKEGDILKVYKVDIWRGVYCEMPRKLNKNKFYGVDNDNGNIVIFDNEYVVLEGYEPKVKEVKREAKVGEWIKIVEPRLSFGLYREGDIRKVVYKPIDSGLVKIEVCHPLIKEASVFHEEYVVLEGYEPEKK